MITKELVDRINYLARKKKNEGLTAEEAEEQQQVREIYLKGIREQVKASLETVKKPQNDTHHDKHEHSCNCHHCKH